MSKSEFAEYESVALSNYASDLLTADHRNPETAAARANEAFRKILSEGQDTPNHHFFILFDSDVSAAVGWLWLGDVISEHGRSAFIYDILVRPEYRGQGHGTRALQAAEAWASTLGMQHIDLHVFGHNAGAQRLYNRAGYRATNIRMRRALTGTGSASSVTVRRGAVTDYKVIDAWDEFSGDRRSDATSGCLYVAEIDGTVVGYVVCGTPVFHHQVFISQLCVAPSHRRRGVAVALLSAIVNQYGPSEIWTSTEHWNEAAIATFSNLGFERRGGISGMNKDGSDEVYFSRPHTA